MSNCAVFDFSVADSYASKTLPVSGSGKYRVTYEATYSAGTAQQVGNNADGDIFELNPSPPDGGIGGVYPNYFNGGNPPGWYAYGGGSLQSGNQVFAGIPFPVDVLVEFNSGTSWDITYTMNGNVLGTLTTDLGHDASTGVEIAIGSRYTDYATGFAVQIATVTVTDDVSTTLFQDDWSSNDFSNWDSTSGTCSVVACVSVLPGPLYAAPWTAGGSLDTYLAKRLTDNGGKWTFLTDVWVDGTTLGAISGASGGFGTIIAIITFAAHGGDRTGIGIQDVGGGVYEWLNWFGRDAGPSGTVTRDQWITIETVLQFVSGTTWSLDYSIDGVPLYSFTYDFGVDDSVSPDYQLGGIDGAEPLEHYWFQNAVIKDSGDATIFSDLPASDFSAWSSSAGIGLALTTDPVPGPSPASGRLGYDMPWRFVVTDLDIVAVTWAEGLFHNRVITFTGNQPTTIAADVNPDDFQVNGLWTDGYPRIAQSKRIVFAYRREGATGNPFGTAWRLRAAGILMSPNDQADADVPLSSFVAYDPRQYLGARPAMDAYGGLPGPLGFTMIGPGNETALTFLANTINNEGGVFIDAGTDWGGTSEWAGTIETTEDIVVNVAQGQSVQDVWDQLCDAGNLDIVLTPIDDPDRTITVTVDGTPTVFHFTHDLSIYRIAGENRYSSVFAWDMMQRNVETIDRMHDGTPGAFFNKVLYYTNSGAPIPAAGPLINAASVTAFYSYWAQQTFPSYGSNDPTGAALLQLAEQALVLAKQGRRTVTLDTITGRAPEPLKDYNVFDYVPVWATKRLRAVISSDFSDDPISAFRVEGIPIQISDDGVETVLGLLLSPDFRSASS